MMHSPHSVGRGSSSNVGELREVFVRRVHQLLQLGYERLTPGNYAKEEEPAITGFLAEAIDRVLCDRTAPWMSCFSVHDDPPVNDGRRKGKQRKRVDLRIDSGRFKPRARFRFEAKRLSKRHPVRIYLGREGLGCFLRGDYAREDNEAGMLGYVQSGNLEEWSAKIGYELNRTSVKYAFDTTFRFSAHLKLSTESLGTYRSRHNRSSVGRSIRIVHTLLKLH